MSARAELWVEEHYRSPNRRGASQRKFVLYVIARAANDEGVAGRTSVEAIARKVDQDTRTVRRHLRELEHERVLHVAIVGSAVSVYRIPAVAHLTTQVKGLGRLSCEHSTPICEACLRNRMA